MTSAASRVKTVARDLRAAGGAELFWRASRRLAAATGRIRARFPPGPLSDDDIRAAFAEPHGMSAASWASHLRSPDRSGLLFGVFDRERLKTTLRKLPEDDRARRLAQGEMLLFGRLVAVGCPPDWHRDPISGARWSAAHWSELPVTAGDGADVRNIWELSRHRDLFVLGRAWWRSGDRMFADAAALRIASWIQANPPEMGINWWSNLEVAMRAQAWVWALHFFADALDPALLWTLTGSLVSSARHIDADLPFTRRTMPGNHVIGDAAGLAMIALALPELRESAGWRDRAIALLEAEAASQIRADGTHDELSPSYHAFVWELLFAVMALAERNGVAMPRTRDALQRMARALVLVSTPDGEAPPLGDSDEAVAWDLGDSRRRAGAIAALAASLLDVGEVAPVADWQAEELVWFKGILPPEGGSHRPPVTLPLTSTTGFGICARSSWTSDADYCLLRHGGLSKHTHADALNVLVTAGGVPCLIDAGTGSYGASQEWRRFFRGTSAHSTVQVDGLNQAEPHRTFRWSTALRSHAQVVQEKEDALFVVGEHDGFQRIGVNHARAVLWIRRFGWIVVDRVSGAGSHLVELRWIMPGAAIPGSAGARLIAGSRTFELAISSGPVTAFRAADQPRAGWTSPGYGRREPALCLCAAARQRLPCTFVTVLAPLDRPVDSVALTCENEAGDAVAVRASAGHRTVAVSIAREGWGYLPA